MDATPKKLVHWALDVSFSGLNSPFSEASSTESTATSSLQYINAQLIAHGFTHSPGLSLDGLSKDDTDRIIKCLLGMLGQRVDDMSRTEDLTTKIRTLSYDHERLLSMHNSVKKRAANAEREMNVHKSRLNSATRSLQSSEAAHKHTTAELQRTRTSLQAIRTAHQAEIKKLEKEKERMAERWNKLADAQTKLSVTSSGLRCANGLVVDAPEVQMRGQGQGFVEVALEQAERSCKDLYEQNRKLRGLILRTVNETQNILHSTSKEAREEPTPFTTSTLFPMSPAEFAGEKMSTLLASLQDTISKLSDSNVALSPSTSATDAPKLSKPRDSAEAERLQSIIDSLRRELDEAQKHAAACAAQTQELFDRFAENERMTGDMGEMSVDLMTMPARDEERARLNARFQELEEERRKFTEAAIRLGREKAALETEHIKFLEEKRSWQVEMMLCDLPPTPAPPSSDAPVAGPSHQQIAAPPQSPHKSPRKAKAAVAVGKAGSGKKVRVSRRSSGLGGLGAGLVPPKKVIPPYETELIPSPALLIPTFKTSITVAPAQPRINAPVFVLPPPSPAASLDQAPRISSSLLPLPSLATSAQASETRQKQPPAVSSESAPLAGPSQLFVPIPLPESQSAPEVVAEPSAPIVPSTPIVRRPFPMAKPLAAGHMRHAYSPAKPSPLSRILMLANSPESLDIDRPQLDVLEEDDESSGAEASPTPAPPVPVSMVAAPQKSLAAELGIADDDDAENPLRDKRLGANVVKTRTSPPTANPAAKDKGKARSEPAPPSRVRPAVGLEKENVKRAKLSVNTTASSRAAPVSEPAGVSADRRPPPNAKLSARPKVAGKAAPGKGGARRVPIGSAEAAPVGPAWKG